MVLVLGMEMEKALCHTLPLVISRSNALRGGPRSHRRGGGLLKENCRARAIVTQPSYLHLKYEEHRVRMKIPAYDFLLYLLLYHNY